MQATRSDSAGRSLFGRPRLQYAGRYARLFARSHSPVTIRHRDCKLLVGGALVILLLALAPTAAAQEVVHVVQPGDSLGFIALTYGTTVDAIVKANGLPNPDVIWVGQTLVIPIQGAGSQDPEAPSASANIYTVKLGDTLASIAQEQGVTLAALISANGITDPDTLWVGQKLLIPGPPPGSSLPPVRLSETRYTVQPGDTLGRIAQRFNTTAAAIARANRITSPNLIYVGMELAIPAPSWTAPTYPGQVTRFVVSISQQRCWLYRGNTIVADWVCSTGQPGAATRPGTYFIQSKMPVAYGSAWNIWMPYWLGIYWAGGSENGIHGIPYDADSGWRLWEGYVGTPVTFGCILLNDEDAKTLYDLAYLGMPVIVQP
jgi:LysM repeat protein